MARRWLMRNIRVELNHADYWVNWSRCPRRQPEDLQAQQVPPELHA
jgi:pyrroloquinoline quinone (PQQ) biosynthesis protein C